jgi:hypothetical protein
VSVAVCHGDHGRNADGSPVGPHCPLMLYAGGGTMIGGDDPGVEAGDFDPPTYTTPVQAEQGPHGYEVTNRYEDGVVGVDDDSRIDAECDDSPICPLCVASIDHWEWLAK